MHRLQHAVGGLGHGAGFGLAVAALGGVAIAAATAVKAIKDAASYSEQYDRAQVVLGKDARILTDQIDLMNRAFGTNKTEALAAGSAVGAIFKGAGYADEDVAKLSVHVLKLATDLGSLAHIDFGMALEKIMSGLAGQVRPLREVGVFMSDAEIKAYAAAHGIGKLNAELTESEKIQARIGFITEKLAPAVGNRLKTAESPVNEFREAMGRINTILIEIGKVALPVVGDALQGINLILSSTMVAWRASGMAAKESITDVANGAKTVTAELGFMTTPIIGLSKGYEILRGIVGEFNAAVLEAGSFITAFAGAAVGSIKGIADAFISLVGYVGEISQGFLSALGPVGAAFAGLGDMITGITGKLSHFADDWSKYLKTLSGELHKEANKLALDADKHFAFDAAKSLKDFLARGAAEINAAREKLKKEGQLDLTKIKPIGAGVQAGESAHQNKAILAFSSDAANAILKSRYGQAQGGAQAQVARNTGQALPKLDKINESLAKMAANAGTALGLLPIPGLG